MRLKLEPVPDFLKDYIGQEIRGSHVHFAVPGYKELSWAIPLSEVPDFPKAFDGQQGSITSIVGSFAKRINLSTHICYVTPVI